MVLKYKLKIFWIRHLALLVLALLVLDKDCIWKLIFLHVSTSDDDVDNNGYSDSMLR